MSWQIFVTHPSHQAGANSSHTPASVLPRLFRLGRISRKLYVRAKVLLSISVCLPKARAALDARTIFALHTNRLYLTHTPTHPGFRSFRPATHAREKISSRLTLVCPSRRRRSHGSNERRRHLVPRASFLR